MESFIYFHGLHILTAGTGIHSFPNLHLVVFLVSHAHAPVGLPSICSCFDNDLLAKFRLIFTRGLFGTQDDVAVTI
jgi:hypothetical protein